MLLKAVSLQADKRDRLLSVYCVTKTYVKRMSWWNCAHAVINNAFKKQTEIVHSVWNVPLANTVGIEVITCFCILAWWRFYRKKWNLWHGCIFGLHLFLRLLEKLIRSSSSLREGWGEDFLWLFTSQWQRFILSFPSSDRILVNLFTHQSLLSSPEHGRLTKWSFLCLSAGRKRRG